MLLLVFVFWVLGPNFYLGDYLKSYNPKTAIPYFEDGLYKTKKSLPVRFTEIYAREQEAVLVCENSRYRLVVIRRKNEFVQALYFDKFRGDLREW